MKWGACFWNHFSKYSSFDSRGDVINPKFGQKRPKLVFHVPIVIERWKSRVQRNLRCSIRFWNLYFKILKFWLTTQKWVKKVQIDEKDERKMKTKSKRYFEVNYLLMKPFSKNLEVLTQHGDVLNPKLAQKRAQTYISWTNRKMKIKSKRSFEMRYSFMKLVYFLYFLWYSFIFSKSWNSSPMLWRHQDSKFVYNVQLALKTLNSLAWYIHISFYWCFYSRHFSVVSRTPALLRMELFVTLVNDF